MMIDKLNELNIFALRDLARRTGVSSPTSKKKEELIQGIVEILSGDKQPQLNKTKQGRPPKVFGYDFSSVLNIQSMSQGSFNQNAEAYTLDEISTVAGWIELVNNNSALLWVNENGNNQMFFVPKETVMKQDLRNGDRVVAEIVTDDNKCFVKNIFSINDCPINQIQERVNFESLSHCLNNLKLGFQNEGFSKLNICVGENVYLYGDDNNNNTKTVIDMLNGCDVQNKIYVNISLTNKNKIYLQNLKNAELFISNLTDESSLAKRVVALAIERAKRIAEVGEDCIIVVDDMLSILSVDDGQIVKNFAALSISANNGGAITLLAVMPNETLIQIEKLADKRFKIVEGEILNK